MGRFLLNTSAICSLDPAGGLSQSRLRQPIVWQGQNLTRRRFLQGLGTVTALMLFDPTKFIYAMGIDEHCQGAELSCDGTVFWSIDTSWLAGRPVLTFSKRSSELLVSLKGARYPGTDLPADFQAILFLKDGMPTIRMSHSLAKGMAEAHLIKWLAVETTLAFAGTQQPLSIGAGESLRVVQRRSVPMSITPDLEVTANFENAWTLEGHEFFGVGYNMRLSRAGDPLLIDTSEALRRVHIDLRTSPEKTRMTTSSTFINAADYAVGDSRVAYVRVEAAETEQGQRFVAFLSQGSGATLLTKGDARVLVSDPRYGKVLLPGGQEHAVWTGKQGQGVAPVGDHLLITAAASEHPLRIESKSGVCTFDCLAYPKSLALASDARESVSLEFPRIPVPVPASAMSAAPMGVCPFTAELDDLPLDCAEIVFKRPANAMLLRFRLQGFRLIRKGSVVRLQAALDCRLFMLVGAQSVAEQVYYQAPVEVLPPPGPKPMSQERRRMIRQLHHTYARSGIAIKERKKLMRRALKELDLRDSSQHLDPTPPQLPGQARVAGGSQLAFKLATNLGKAAKQKLAQLELSLDHLLDPELWELIVVRDALSSEAVRRQNTSTQLIQHSKAHPPYDATFLEMPSSLYLSPNEQARFFAEGLRPDRLEGHVDIFRLAGDIAQDPMGMPLRVIGTLDFDETRLVPHENPTLPIPPGKSVFRRSMDLRDRTELVWLTSQWDRCALLGTTDVRLRSAQDQGCTLTSEGVPSESQGIYVPKPLYANKLLLSSLGGSLKSKGRWDPPSFNEFALSVERWEHSEDFGRLSFDTWVYKGFLLPFGIRASFVKVSVREESRFNDFGPVSLPQERFYLEISNPLIQYSEFLAPFQGRTWPFRSVRLLLNERLSIDEPASTGFDTFGRSAFRICVDNKGVDFDFEVDGDSTRRGIACLAFVDNELVHHLHSIRKVVDLFNMYTPDQWALLSDDQSYKKNKQGYFLRLLNSKIQYAPPSRGDDTSYATTLMNVRLGLHEKLVNTALIEASGRPPTYAQMVSASIVIPALNRMTGAPGLATTDVQFAPLFMDIGFETAPLGRPGNTGEVFLQLQIPVAMSFAGRSDRAGAICTPNLLAQQLSRSVGLMGSAAEPLTPALTQAAGLPVIASTGGVHSSVKFNPSDLFSPDAKLLGVIPMTALFDVLGLDQVPRFIESIHQQLDAATGDIAASLCKFVEQGKHSVTTLIGEIDTHSAPEALAPLKQHLENFGEALAAISCTVSLETAQQIASAGQALDEAGRYLENLMQHPALLLPASIREVIEYWTSLVKGILEQYERLRGWAGSFVHTLKQQVIDTVAQTAIEVSGLVAVQLQSECNALRLCIERTISQALPSDDQLEQFYAFYSSCDAAFKGVLGWHRELEQEAKVYVRHLRAIGDACEEVFDDLQKGLEDKLEKLDSDLRTWAGSLSDEPRAFFRRVEPAVVDFSDAWHKLEQGAAFSDVTTLLGRIFNALNQLSDAISQARLNQPSQALLDYLARIETDIVELLAWSGSQSVKLQQVLVTVDGQPPVNVSQVLSQLTAALQSSPALSAVLKAVNDAGSDVNEPLKVWAIIRSTLTLAGVCMLARLDAEPDPVAGIMVNRVNVLKSLQQLLTDSILQVNKILLSWIDVVVPTPPNSDLEWVKALKNSGLFGTAFIDDIVEQLKNIDLARAGLKALPVDPHSLTDTLTRLRDGWRALSVQLKNFAQAPDRELLKLAQQQITELASSLVPAQVHLDFNYKTTLGKTVADVFLPGTGVTKTTELKLNAQLVENLIEGTSTYQLSGTLGAFRLKLFDLLIITFGALRFEAASGSAQKLYPPEIINVDFDGCLSIIKQLKDAYSSGNGPYVLPMPSSVKAGYRFSPGMIALGGMIIQDLVIDAGIEIPFDERAAVTTFAVSSRQSPALLFIAPYGGAMFFGVCMAGDRLVSIEASFEAGLVSAFNLGAVRGTGRVTVGFYFYQSGEGISLDGFFYAGGSARIAGIVSLTISLRIGLRYQSSKVEGYGEFSVEMGCRPFTWTLSYGVGYQMNNARIEALQEPAKKDQYSVSNFELPPCRNLFLDKATWKVFNAAFAKVSS